MGHENDNNVFTNDYAAFPFYDCSIKVIPLNCIAYPS